jgi:zinc protease
MNLALPGWPSLLWTLMALALPEASPPTVARDAGTSPPVSAPAGRAPDVIIDDFVKALGGEKALRRHRSLYVRRKVTSTKMGIEGSEERWMTADGRLLSVTVLPGIGEIRAGSSGNGQRWSQDPINGLRMVKGVEAEQARLDSSWNAELQLKKLYPKRKLVPPPAGASTADGKKDGKNMECLEMAPAKVAPVIMCFDRRSHLRVYQEGRQSSPQGELPYSVHWSDWREVEGVMFPHLEEMTAGPMGIDSRLEEVKVGQKLPASLFRMPNPRQAARPVTTPAARPAAAR